MRACARASEREEKGVKGLRLPSNLIEHEMHIIITMQNGLKEGRKECAQDGEERRARESEKCE